MTHIDIDALSSAARIALTEGEKAGLAADVAAIVSLGRVLLAESGETADATALVEGAHMTLRADEPQASLAREEILALAPTSRDGYVTVPRVISEENDREGRA